MSSAFMRSGSHVSGSPSTRSCHQTSASFQGHGIAGAAENDEPFDGWRGLGGNVRVHLERNLSALTPALVLRDQELRPESRSRSASESEEKPPKTTMGRADARAREHRDGKLGNHPHVETDAIPLADSELPQPVREPADLGQQVGVGEIARVSYRLADGVVGDTVSVPPRACRGSCTRRSTRPRTRCSAAESTRARFSGLRYHSMNSSASRAQKPSKSSSASR